jgi:hypothetical protein
VWLVVGRLRELDVCLREEQETNSTMSVCLSLRERERERERELVGYFLFFWCSFFSVSSDVASLRGKRYRI